MNRYYHRQYFLRPLPLLLPHPNGFLINEEASRILKGITEDLVIIAIAGKYRTGKSYILNLLSNLPRNEGFELGSTVQSKTKGIWVYALPHPFLPHTTLVLLDTEGLGDVDKGDSENDTQLLVLTILMCSTFILNVVNRLDTEVINQLGFVSTLVKSMGKDVNNLSHFFPHLFVLVRDFFLDLQIDGQEVSADQYFNDYCLKANKEKLQNGSTLEPRQIIRKYFPKRSCVTLPVPVFDKKLLRKLETVPDDKLNPEFVEDSSLFVKTLLSTANKKTATEQIPINGKILMNLLENYLKQITEGVVPPIRSVLLVTAEKENEILYHKFIAKYDEEIEQCLRLPMPERFLRETHEEILQRLTWDFKRHIIFEEYSGGIKRKYRMELNKRLSHLLSINKEMLRRRCQDRLIAISGFLTDKLNANAFHKEGGHAEFCDDVNYIINGYNSVYLKCECHDEVLFEFITSMNEESQRIQTIECRLVEAQRKAEEEKEARVRALNLQFIQWRNAEEERRRNEAIREEQLELAREMERQLEIARQKEEELEEELCSQQRQEKEESSDDDESCTIL